MIEVKSMWEPLIVDFFFSACVGSLPQAAGRYWTREQYDSVQSFVQARRFFLMDLGRG
jgi:hypothetical protein